MRRLGGCVWRFCSLLLAALLIAGALRIGNGYAETLGSRYVPCAGYVGTAGTSGHNTGGGFYAREPPLRCTRVEE